MPTAFLDTRVRGYDVGLHWIATGLIAGPRLPASLWFPACAGMTGLAGMT